MLLLDYINQNFKGNSAAFGRLMGVDKNAVYRWINKGWIVVDNILYLPKRDIPEASKKEISMITAECRNSNSCEKLEIKSGDSIDDVLEWNGWTVVDGKPICKDCSTVLNGAKANAKEGGE